VTEHIAPIRTANAKEHTFRNSL